MKEEEGEGGLGGSGPGRVWQWPVSAMPGLGEEVSECDGSTQCHDASSFGFQEMFGCVASQLMQMQTWLPLVFVAPEDGGGGGGGGRR